MYLLLCPALLRRLLDNLIVHAEAIAAGHTIADRLQLPEGALVSEAELHLLQPKAQADHVLCGILQHKYAAAVVPETHQPDKAAIKAIKAHESGAVQALHSATREHARKKKVFPVF